MDNDSKQESGHTKKGQGQLGKKMLILVEHTYHTRWHTYIGAFLTILKNVEVRKSSHMNRPIELWQID